MDKNFESINKLLSTFVRWEITIGVTVFTIIFLFIIGSIGFLYPQGYFYRTALIFLFILAIIGIIALFLLGVNIFKCSAMQLHKDLDFNIFNEIDDVIIVSDLSGFVYYSNQSYQKIFTYKPEASCYVVISDLPNTGALLYRLKAAILGGSAAQEVLRTDRSIFINSQQKDVIWYNISIHPTVHRGKKLLFWRITDVSHLQQYHQYNETFFLNSQEVIGHLDEAPIGFLSVNAQGIITYLNTVFAKWFLIDLTNFTVGQYSFDQLFHSVRNNSTWSDIRRNNNKYQNLNGTIPYTFSLYSISETGNKRILNCFMYASSLIENEAIYRIIMIPQKIEKNESNNQSKLPSILTKYFNVSPFAIAVVTQKGQFIYVNNAFLLLTGKSSKAVSLYDIISPCDHVQLEHVFQQIIENKNYSAPIETVLEGDQKRYLRLYTMLVTLEHDNALQDLVIVSGIEITEQKMLEDKMIQNQKMQAVGQLAGGIAHDFNNVLTAILMSCDFLLNTHRSFDPAYADLINIKNNANRAAALVQQLLAFSRKQTLRPKKVDFTELLSDIRNLILPLLGNNIQLKIIHGKDLWDVKVDQASFQRVIMNLVINARDAMLDGGIVTITTNNITKQQSAKFNYAGFVVGEYVQLTVSDTGTGISAVIQEKMFEPFFTTKEVGKGTGLGLSMVYGIIKQTGGYIYCDSQEGEGTTFHIFLPRYISDMNREVSQQIEKIEEQEKNTDLTGSATVLLVEDEYSVRMSSVRALQMRGYTVLEAASGVEALAILEKNKGAVDIIVSDVVMPEMDGPTLLIEARKNYPDIKIIFVSGYTKDAFTKNLPEDTVFGFLSKPFTLKQLALAVKETLAQ
ncbi:PAS domain-containing sensor histidine kinase [Bartonella sp. 1-1C]|uniref:hybrid sensor histidine kinase/response regulator n=1 Tax=Bartonella sp. 1-1C TaxID=515256 RepID=UPI0001F4C6C6|nr:PAS domain-containing sensor histidine kinase [Bartonella sp. 1-1C]ATO57421.1 cell cycle control histidine kinase CckA [Bartonella sp. 1-1C]CBI80838.1 Sensor protein [Bartonella sp. 1-1C]